MKEIKEKYLMPQTQDLQPKDSVVYCYVGKIVFNLNKIYNLKPESESDLDVIYYSLMRVMAGDSFEARQKLLQEVLHGFKVLNRNESDCRTSLLLNKGNIISNYINNKNIKVQDDVLSVIQDAIKVNQTLLETLEYMHTAQYDA